MGEIDVTEGLSDEQQKGFEMLLQERIFEKDVPILEEGLPCPGLFLMHEGSVSVSKFDMGGLERLITEIEAPAILGELELLTSESCSATVKAVNPVRSRLLPMSTFEELLDRGDPAAVRVMRNLARALGAKLNATNEVYVDLAIWR